MTSFKYTKTDFEKILATIQRNLDSQWVTGQAFQKDIAEIAFNKLKKRSIGWLSHWSVWKDDNETKFEKAFDKFEKKHMSAYKRWKKTTGISGNFELKSGVDTLEERVVKLFLYYLVYGEIHDFRALKNVFHLFYHCALEKFADNEKQIAVWIREQGSKLFKILAVMFSKEEMNMQCFHHDDLDDLCGSSWAKSSFYKDGKDFLQAFGLDDSKSSKFPSLAKLLQLDTPTFILYWTKSSQPDLNKDETKKKARDKWIRENFLENQEDISMIEKLSEEIQVIKDRLDNSSKTLKQQEDRWKQETRPRPSVTDFNRPDAAESFHMALTQFETAKDLLASAESTEATAMNHLKDAKIKYFNMKKDAVTEYKQAFKILAQLQQDYEECEKGFARTLEGFGDRSLSSECMSYILEAKYLQAKATYKKLFIVDLKLKNSISRILQFAYEDAIMQERFEFAHKWKTYFEKAGGPLGLWGYVTVFYHYAQIVYLHTLLLIPMLWLYFGYHKQIDTADPVGSLMKLVDMANISSPKKNLILPLGFPIILCLLFFFAFNILFRWRLRGVSAPRRDAGCKSTWSTQSRLICFFLWILTIVVEIVVMNYMVIEPIKNATTMFTRKWHFVKSPILLFVHWVPVLVLYFSSIQFVFTLWVGIFGWFFGIRDRVTTVRNWKNMVARFEKRPMKGLEKVTVDKGKEKTVDLDDDLLDKDPGVPLLVDDFAKSMIPNEDISDQRKYVAFAKIWNSIILYFYDIHKLSKEELQRYSYKIKIADDMNPDQCDYLSGVIDKEPELKKEPLCKEVSQHLIKFVNNLQMDKPTKRITVEEMLPLCVVTPVGAEKILYPYEFITHVDNTQNSFLQHLIDRVPIEWQNFKNKECLSEKAKDWVDRMEKDTLQRAGNEEVRNKKSKKWIDATPDGQELKKKICEWASLRFQALYRTVHGFMQAPRALQVLARIQDPNLSQEAAEELVRSKFNYVVGYQSFSSSYKLYKSSKERAKRGENLTKAEIEAHDVVYNIKYLKKKFPDLKIAFPDSSNGKHYGRLVCGNSKIDKQNCRDYCFELFGPFSDMGLGKPAHQNFLSHFVDGMVIQTIDVNQDNVISQSFFVPNVIAEFDQSPVKIVGCPEFVITSGWSSTAWCSAFVERTFGTISHRSYSRMGIRLHYGHPDYIDAMWVMCETGLSKLPYVSEDIFTGFDTVLKGGRIIHIEYHEVGKARDVDLYTTTKFTRKISMGASQMACSRYINQLQSSSSISYFQALSYYYSTSGFYVNHLILYLSVWFALASQLVLIILQRFFFSNDISGLITTRIFTFQIGLALVTPGVFQLILERGVIGGLWAYFSHFFILAVYSTFHILNFASYWQWGLVNSAFYLASGRGTGLEHYFMKDMYENFYKTHWRAGFLIFWMGVLALVISGDILVFCVMYLLPSAVWLWGAMFLNPGSLPSTVHEEQWKRLMNRDMNETREIVKQHAKIHEYHPATKGNFAKRFFVGIGRSIKYAFRLLHWIYTVVNFAIQMRVLRFIALMSMVWEFIFSEKIPTFIFTDERRRVIRWDEDSSRSKSIFFSTLPKKNNMLRSNGSNNKLKRPPIPFTTNNNQDTSNQPAISSDSRPLPTPPSANRDLLKKAQFAKSKHSHNFDQ